MIRLLGEITPEWYDIGGRKVFRPDSRRESGANVPGGPIREPTPKIIGARTSPTSDGFLRNANMSLTKRSLVSRIIGSRLNDLKRARREIARTSRSGYGDNSST